MASSKKGISKSKILFTIIIITVIVSASIIAAQYTLNTSANNLPSMTLTLIGSDGTTKTLSENDIVALQPYKGQGASRSSGVVKASATYTGVPLSELIALVGGMKDGETLVVTAKDGYSNTYTYNQVVNGQDFRTYLTDGSVTTATQPIKLVLIYNRDGATLGTSEGPLMIGALSPEGLATDGNLWAKMVVRITVTSAPTASPQPSPSTTAQPTAKPTTPVTVKPTTSPTASNPTPTPSVTVADCQVTIIGADNSSRTLNKEDLLAYTMTYGLGGKYRSDKGIFGYGTYQGVSITALLNEVGGFQSSQILSVKAADGYVKNYTYGQVIGTELTMYDPATISVATPTHPVTMILAYAYNGTSANLETVDGGGQNFLMISFVGQDGYATISNLFVKSVTEIRVYNA